MAKLIFGFIGKSIGFVILLPFRILRVLVLFVVGLFAIGAGKAKEVSKDVSDKAKAKAEKEQELDQLVMIVLPDKEEMLVLNYTIDGKVGTTEPFKESKLEKFIKVLQEQEGVDPLSISIQTVEGKAVKKEKGSKVIIKR
jgi:hypothetical protein